MAQPGTGDGGGLNVYVVEVARRLGRLGLEVEVFTRAASPEAPPTVELEPRVRVHHVVAGPTRPIPKEAVPMVLPAFTTAMVAHPAAFDLDLLHSHYWLSGWVARRVAARLGIAAVHTFHTFGVVKDQARHGDEPRESERRLRVEQRLADRADHLIALTCGEARLLHRTFGTSGRRISVVPAGVDLDRFPPRVDQDLEGPPLLLFVGRLQPVKGPDIAVRTLAEVRRQHPDARLLVVGGVSGNGAGRSGPVELFELADELGVRDAVEFQPARPQNLLAELYRRATVVLVPSRSESFGLVALEAQASGTPVVAADVGGLSYVVRHGGTLVSGHDPVVHAAAVSRYLADPTLRARTGRRGREWAESFSWDRTVRGLTDVYAAVGRPALREAG